MKTYLLAIIILIATTEAWGAMAELVPQPLGNLLFASTIYVTLLMAIVIQVRKR